MGTPRKPDAIDLERPSHRLMVVRAYFHLLSEGLDESEAKLRAASYAMEHWEELK